MSSPDDGSLDRYIGQTIPYTFHPGFVVLSYVISVLGAGSTLELIHRRTSLRGVYNLLLLIGAAISMQGIAIWSMHFIGNRAITLRNGEPELQILYSVQITVASFFVPVVVLLLAFIAVNINQQVKWWRVIVAGALSGGAICGMHYLGDAAISNYECHYNIPNVVGAAVIAVAASIGALALLFVFSDAWAFSVLRRVGVAIILAGAVSGMHWCAASGTSYTLRHVVAPGGRASRNTTVVAVICLSVIASCVMVTAAVCTARTKKRYAAKAQQIVLAAAVFDKRGRILVTPDGLLPSEMITEVFPQKSTDDYFSTAHPLFHWMYRASRNWSSVATVLGWMKTHLDSLSQAGRRGMRSIRLIDENGHLVQNYDIIFRELFCVAASTLAARMAQDITNAGALWDETFATGTSNDSYRRDTVDDKARTANSKDKAGDVQDQDELLERGLRPSQDHVGRGSLLFLVRHVKTTRDVAALEASGYRFAEPRRVVDIIRSSMQIRSQKLEEKLLDMATCTESEALADPCVHVGLFALRARVDKFGFDVLVDKASRSSLPTARLPLKKLEPWHHEFLRGLDGLSIPALLQRLNVPIKDGRPVELQFSEQLRRAVCALRDGFDGPGCEEAVLSCKVVQMPCKPPLGTAASSPGTCPLITLQVMLNINNCTTVRGSRWTFVPFRFFKVRQLVYENSSHHGVFSRALHREMSSIMAYLPTPAPAPTKDSRMTHVFDKSTSTLSLFSRQASRGGRESDDELGLTENSSNGRGRPLHFEPASPTTHGQHQHNVSSSEPWAVGGIMISQEVVVDVQDAEQEEANNSQTSTTQKLAASGTPTKRNVLVSQKSSSMRQKGDHPFEMDGTAGSEIADPVVAPVGGAGVWNVEAVVEENEETTFLDELIATCVKRRP